MNDQNSSQSNNPYAPPTANVGFVLIQENADFISNGRSVPAGNGITWISAAWKIFKRKPGA